MLNTSNERPISNSIVVLTDTVPPTPIQLQLSQIRAARHLKKIPSTLEAERVWFEVFYQDAGSFPSRISRALVNADLLLLAVGWSCAVPVNRALVSMFDPPAKASAPPAPKAPAKPKGKPARKAAAPVAPVVPNIPSLNEVVAVMTGAPYQPVWINGRRWRSGMPGVPVDANGRPILH